MPLFCYKSIPEKPVAKLKNTCIVYPSFTSLFKNNRGLICHYMSAHL
jgi:hypothetical protein